MTQRPIGITVISILMIIGGLILIFTGITPLFIGPLISIDSSSSNYQTSALGFLITIGGLTLVGRRDLTHIISVIIYGIIIYYMFTNKVKLFFGKFKERAT